MRVPPSVATSHGEVQALVAAAAAEGRPVAELQPRMPWHDVALALGPPAALDVAMHFVQVCGEVFCVCGEGKRVL